jgi:hypothetical protein
MAVGFRFVCQDLDVPVAAGRHCEVLLVDAVAILGNGGIVDVHLEKGEYRIAVEIAVASKPQRELAHMKHCLAVGYDKVFDVFAEERLLERTEQALTGGLSDEERAKVQLLHLSKLSDLIYNIAGEREKVILPVELTQEV